MPHLPWEERGDEDRALFFQPCRAHPGDLAERNEGRRFAVTIAASCSLVKIE
jgi:hypothetical protein